MSKTRLNALQFFAKTSTEESGMSKRCREGQTVTEEEGQLMKKRGPSKSE